MSGYRGCGVTIIWGKHFARHQIGYIRVQCSKYVLVKFLKCDITTVLEAHLNLVVNLVVKGISIITSL
jgi:hypothetical protein